MSNSVIQTFLLEGPIDFAGQQLSDSITFYLLSTAGIASFLAGFVANNISITFYTFAAFFSAGLILVIPAWPYYNRHPLKWLTKSD
ncbi:microsomal signal peptidase 12kDa subunit [Lipomyces arxii]|uniref:microsomal signal peptidase 12kDa subunit n=1 Tax=Lipomyces arxii TaxID=56418 RepID=UPI0034CE7EDE